MAFVKITEQPSLYDNLEKKSVLEILQDINTEDQKVALAVKKAIPQIEKLVSQIVPRMKQGGRIFYMGAGTSGRLGASQPRFMSSSAFSTGLRKAVSPPAISPMTNVGGIPNVGGISEASSTPRRPLVPAPI